MSPRRGNRRKKNTAGYGAKIERRSARSGARIIIVRPPETGTVKMWKMPEPTDAEAPEGEDVPHWYQPKR